MHVRIYNFSIKSFFDRSAELLPLESTASPNIVHSVPKTHRMRSTVATLLSFYALTLSYENPVMAFLFIFLPFRDAGGGNAGNNAAG